MLLIVLVLSEAVLVIAIEFASEPLWKTVGFEHEHEEAAANLLGCRFSQSLNVARTFSPRVMRRTSAHWRSGSKPAWLSLLTTPQRGADFQSASPMRRIGDRSAIMNRSGIVLVLSESVLVIAIEFAS